jgi:hypothetical protein
MSEYYDRPDVRERRRRQHAEYTKRHPDRVNARARDRNRRAKTDVVSQYGGQCACCGEHRIEFLSIDHVNGDGAEHRRSVVGPGYALYMWLQKNGYPEGFRVLCMNCNTSLGKWGYCPHGNVTIGVVSSDADCHL